MLTKKQLQEDALALPQERDTWANVQDNIFLCVLQIDRTGWVTAVFEHRNSLGTADDTYSMAWDGVEAFKKFLVDNNYIYLMRLTKRSFYLHVTSKLDKYSRRSQ